MQVSNSSPLSKPLLTRVSRMKNNSMPLASPAAKAPARKLTRLEGGVTQIENSVQFIDKGRPAVEYKSSGGWTSINNPLAYPMPRFAQSIYCANENSEIEDSDEYDEGEEGPDEGPDEGPETEKEEEGYMVQKPLGKIDGLDLAAVLKKDRAKFGKEQEKVMRRWIFNNKTCLVNSHMAAFDAMLKELGFQDKSFSAELLQALRTKVRGRLQSIKEAMVRVGAITAESKESGKLVLAFAVWANEWANEEWDGSYEAPVTETKLPTRERTEEH